MDLHSYLIHFVKNNTVKTYLEIGTREGDSLACVVKDNPNLMSVFCCDMWGNRYGGTGRGSEGHIEVMLQDMGYKNGANFLNGNSTVRIPPLKLQHRDYFDLILVDGDHSAQGGRKDLDNVLPLCKSGGTILFHDITHPQHLYLEGVFDNFCDTNKRKIAATQKIKVGLGIGVIKIK